MKHLNQVRALIPAACMRPDTRRAIACIALGITFHAFTIALGVLAWRHAWAWSYPLCWLLIGTSATSLFVLGHDCGHRALLKSQRAMTILGHLFFLPTLYPFYAWQFSHQAHHRYTNRMARTRDVDHDNAWLPLSAAQYQRLHARSRLKAWLYRTARVILPLGSTIHMLSFHFRPRLFRPAQRAQVQLSLAVLLGALALASGIALATTSSLWLVLHLWLLPALSFQIWMSVYTFLHHTADDKRVYEPDAWTPFVGNLHNTVNVLFPRVVSFLHFNIDVHVPHHVSTKIPCYHLREANAALRQSAFAAELCERPFTARYLLQQIRSCQVWDEQAERYAAIEQAQVPVAGAAE